MFVCSGAFSATHHANDARPANFDQANISHQCDKAVDFVGWARNFKNKTFGCGVDWAGAEDVREPQGLYPVITRTNDLHQRQFPLNMGARFGQIDNFVDRNKPIQLRFDLINNRWGAIGHNCDPTDRVIFADVSHSQAVDVLTARGEQSGDLGQDTRLVINRNGEHVTLGFAMKNFHVSPLHQCLRFVCHGSAVFVTVQQHFRVRGA